MSSTFTARLRQHLHALSDGFVVARALENGEISAAQTRDLMTRQHPVATTGRVESRERVAA